MDSKKAKAAAIIAGAVLALVAFLLLYFTVLSRPKSETPSSSAPAESASLSIPALVDTLPDSIWAGGDGEDTSGFTTRAGLGSDAESIGVLTIEKIGLECHVFDSDESSVMEDMRKGAAHYKSTSYFQGNVGLSAHNGNASYSFFDELPQLREGDIIIYSTELGEKRYEVRTIATIADDDWSYLGRTEDNRITLTTCITGQPDKRLCIQGVEI